jgi:hypothetical protein
VEDGARLGGKWDDGLRAESWVWLDTRILYVGMENGRMLKNVLVCEIMGF